VKFKKLLVLIAACAVLLVMAVAKQRAGGPPSVALDASSGETVVGSKFSAADASRLDIYRGKGETERVTLSKDASGRWTVTNHFNTRARKEGVEGLLNHLAELRGELRSDTQELLKDYSITDDEAFHFEVTDAEGKTLAHRLVSALRPRGTQNFIREAGSDKVVVTLTDILADIGIYSDADKLNYKIAADLRPAGIDSSQASLLELTQPGKKKLTFKKTQEKDKPAVWSLAEDASAKVDETQLQSFFASIFNLYALDTVDPAGREKDFPVLWIRAVSGPSDKQDTYGLSLGPKDTANATTQVRTADGLIYAVPQAQLDMLLQKTKESFLKKS